MIKVHEKKVLDEKGRECAVQISAKEFWEIREYVEDIEDSLELAKAMRTSKGFKLWKDFVAELKSKN